jgi:saccharopine dehydrogenase-like NADP-dependent oxidoreductase
MSRKSVIILGAGLVGRPMALDLLNNDEYEVGIADYSEKALEKFKGTKAKIYQRDLSESSQVKEVVQGYDLVINAVPGAIGFNSLKSIIEANKNVIDIAFYPENPFDLNELAKQHGVCAICDMGVAPGMSHLLSGFAASQLEKVEKILIYVGGLPKVRTFPWEYKAVFSPSDVIEEYTRPARLIENGQVVFKEALSEPELIDFENVGTLEAFNSDGLRSLVYTISADYMAEKTLRYQGHIDKIKVLKKSGFFGTEPVLVDKAEVIPLEFTKKMLFPSWKLGENEEDFTVMRIIVEGMAATGKRKRFTYDLYDTFDATTRIHSMARTTGYSATAALRLLDAGIFTSIGINVPEFVGKNEKSVRFILEKLRERGIHYKEEIIEL